MVKWASIKTSTKRRGYVPSAKILGEKNDVFSKTAVFSRQEFIVLRTALGGDTRNIAEPTYKTFNLPTRQKYDRIQDFQPTYKTFNRPHTRLSTYLQGFQQTTIQKSDRIQDFQPTN